MKKATMCKTVKVRVPATTANLGPGFDVLGASLSLYNELEVSIAEDPKKAKFVVAGEGRKILPKDERNILWKAMDAVFMLLDQNDKYSLKSFNIKLTNNIPLSSGLGSSSAARAAGIIAANQICGNKMTLGEMAQLGVKLEGHPDNIIPAFYGGVCVSINQGNDVIDVIKLPIPKIKAVVCTPGFELATERSRNILPSKYDRKDVVFNISRVALLTKAFCTNDFKLLQEAMQDKIHQPYRAKLIPVMQELIDAAVKEGAYGACLSGAGPSMIAFCDNSKAEKIAKAMAKIWKKETVPTKTFILSFDKNGAEKI
ncbi:MAG: homoserine kinase [Elusimicrobia bacterium]|nr:homoserine kinase [Elusimicrobiota bacterium]